MSEQESLDVPGFLAHGQEEIRKTVASVCRRFGAAAEIEDMRQLVAVRLLERRKKKELPIDSPKKLFGYIRQIVIRELPRERARATGRGRTHLVEPATLAEIAPARGDSSADTPSIDELLALIPDERQREACRLYFVEGLKLEEVGNRVGVSTSTAFRLVRSAQEVLRIQLGATADPPEGVK